MKPLSLLVKPAAGLCNISCRYCFYKEACKTRENRIMTDNAVDRLILKIKQYQPSALTVMFQGGEPTLAGHEFFESFVLKIKSNLNCPTSFALQTNGVLLDDRFARFFWENGFLVGISLDGNRQTNDRYRLDKDSKSTFDKTLNAISLLKKYKVEFNILSVIDDENAKDIESSYAFFKRQGLRFLQFIPCVEGENGVSLSLRAYESFLKKSFDLWYDDYVKGDYVSIRHIDNYLGILLGNPPENCAMCGVCGSYFVVEANGDLYPCDFYCTEEHKLGSIFDENPFEINVKQKAFTDESLLIHEHCTGCKYYMLCRGGCKRDRTNGFTENRFCEAYKSFFDYAAQRMLMIARSL